MVTSNLEQVESLALKLFEINAFKFGDFKMKVGINSPVYFDLRVIISYPEVMETVSNLIIAYFKEHGLNAKRICGVPYTALPLATLVSIRQNIPMLFRRKEAKSYGTKKLIEGVYQSGDTCIIIEDVITSGSSVLDTAKDLQREGIVVTDAVVLVDREQGGVANIERHSIKVHSLLSLSFLMKTLVKHGKLQNDVFDSVTKYLKESQIDEGGNLVNKPIEKDINQQPRWKTPFEERASLAKCEQSKSLFNLMASKKTNLCLAADLTKTADVLDIADKCGPFVCILKIHVDILEDFREDFISDLKTLSKKHNFLIMEDRKFADIGHTVSLQYRKGLYKISNWADLITVHTMPGDSILQGLKASGDEVNKSCGIFVVGEMSSHNNLINNEYKEKTAKIAMDENNAEFVAGIVCQSADCFSYPGLIQLTPGVKIQDSVDQLGQVYNTPEYVVKEKKADICVVGRGILESKSIEKTAALYRDRLWSAYTDRLSM